MVRQAHVHRLVDPYEADKVSVAGLDILRQSAMAIPSEQDWSLLDRWGDREEAILRA